MNKFSENYTIYMLNVSPINVSLGRLVDQIDWLTQNGRPVNFSGLHCFYMYM